MNATGNDHTTSAIWQGTVRHRRFAPKPHAFAYSLFMLGRDLDEVASLAYGRWFAVERAGLLSFRRDDYLKGSQGSLKEAAWQKVAELGGSAKPHERVLLLGNVRCMGFYFSPVNFYFCYQQGAARYLLTEVSNTPWNERHYYLLDLAALVPHDKDFHVSPFMELAMRYHWRIRPPEETTLIHIASYPQSSEAKLFDATLTLRREPLSRKGLMTLLVRWPWMTLKVLLAIYWQALRLLIKRTPIFNHPETR